MDASRGCSELKRVASPGGQVQVSPIEDLGFDPSSEPSQSETTNKRSAANLDTYRQQGGSLVRQPDVSDSNDTFAVRVDDLGVEHMLSEQKLVREKVVLLFFPVSIDVG
jgi:hypothetical protein